MRVRNAPASEKLLWQAVDQIADATVERSFDALPFLTAEAFPAFIAAWLVRSLQSIEDEDHLVRQFTLYGLTILYQPANLEDEAVPYRRGDEARLGF